MFFKEYIFYTVVVQLLGVVLELQLLLLHVGLDVVLELQFGTKEQPNAFLVVDLEVDLHPLDLDPLLGHVADVLHREADNYIYIYK